MNSLMCIVSVVCGGVLYWNHVKLLEKIKNDNKDKKGNIIIGILCIIIMYSTLICIAAM